MTALLDTTTWGPQLRNVRDAAGLTVADLGERADCSRETVELVDAGDHLPTDALKVRLARALDVHPHRLFPLVRWSTHDDR